MTNSRCARNLPQHFNGCSCQPAPASVQPESDVDLTFGINDFVDVSRDAEPGKGDRFDSIDVDVFAIQNDGALARGVVNAERRTALTAWEEWAEDHREADFEFGLHAAQVALMADAIPTHPDYDPTEDPDPRTLVRAWAEGGGMIDAKSIRMARELMGTKRANIASRAFWQETVQHAPSSQGQNGYITAAAVMSGYEATWNLAADRGRTARRGWAS